MTFIYVDDPEKCFGNLASRHFLLLIESTIAKTNTSHTLRHVIALSEVVK